MNRKQAKRRRRRMMRRIALLFSLIGILSILGIAIFLTQSPKVVIAENLRFPAGSSVTLSELILSVEHGTLLEANREIQSDTAGTVPVFFKVRNRIGIDKDFNLTLTFYDPPVTDTIAPVITAPEELSIKAGGTLDLMEGVSATDETDGTVPVSISGEYDFNRPGTYTVLYSASDLAGNKTEKTLTLTILFDPFGEDGKAIDGTYITPTGRTLVIQNGMALADGYLILNKSFSVSKEYMGGSRSLTAETEAAYYQMRNAAAAEGITISIKSGTRNWNDQNYIFNNYVRAHGLEEALTFSARPGHSEHQTGLAMDLVTSSTQEATENPTVKAALKWLNDNAYKYGFILRYPDGKSNIHGYIFEAWHYRYVGTELATTLYNNGDWITMEEYFGLDSVYRGY